jgi:hypothetical protein
MKDKFMKKIKKKKNAGLGFVKSAKGVDGVLKGKMKKKKGC